MELDRPTGERGTVRIGPLPDARSNAPPTAYGDEAFASLLEWDGRADSSLPPTVSNRLAAIPTRLPPEYEVWLWQPR